MADGSRYLECDSCGAVYDRRPTDDWKTGGTYPYGFEQELFRDVTAAGWKIEGEKHYCPQCANGQQLTPPKEGD